MAKRYHITTVTPEIAAYNFTSGEILCNLTKLPLPVRGGESCRLMNIQIVDGNNLGTDIIFVFTENNSGGNLGTAGSGSNISFDNMNKNVFLAITKVMSHTNIGSLDLYEEAYNALSGRNIILRGANEGPNSSGNEGCYFSLITSGGYDSSAAAANKITITFSFET